MAKTLFGILDEQEEQRRRHGLVPTHQSLSEDEKPRLSKQNALILERLRIGPATNRELARIALKYTSRLSDLRKYGYTIKVVSRDRTTGETVYQLVEGQPC